MWLLPVLLLWVPSGEQADLTKAVVTLHPPWVNVFPEEDVTLQCEGPSVPGDNSTLWFHNSSVFQTLTPRYSFTVASVNDSGEYRCQTVLSVPSDPVQLEVHRDWLLLQVSNRAFTEGEPLALRCHGWKNLKVFNIVFYQNGKSFKFSPFQNELTILKTNLSHNGIYHCSGKRKHLYTSAEVSITVKELFPAPVLKTSVSLPLLEGNLLNLSCETKLLLQRPGLQLYFSFYMGNKTLKGRDTSSEYQILSVKTENSGLYWCKAATEDGNVIKSSPELALLVLGHESQNPVWFHVFFYLIMGIIFLVCTILGVTMRKKLRERNHFDLKILASTCGAKITSYFRKDGYLVEELNYWEQDDKQQHEGIDMKQLQEKEQQ